MADDILIKIQADDKGAKVAVDELTGKITNLANATAKAGESAKKSSVEYEGFFTKFEREAIKVLGYTYAIKKAFEFAEIGAGIREQKIYLDSFARSYGTTADRIIEKTKAISEGQMGMEQAIRLASTALSRGLSPDAFYKIVDAGIKLKNVLGVDTYEAVNNLVDGITKANERSLRSAGIYADLNAALRNYADATNKGVESLSLAERQTIALNIVLQKTDEIMGRTGGTITTVADRMEVFKTQIEDIKSSIQIGASYIGQGILSLANMLAAAITKEFEYLFWGIEKVASAAEKIGISAAAGIRVWARDNAEAARLSAEDLKRKWFEVADFEEKTIQRTTKGVEDLFEKKLPQATERFKDAIIDVEGDIKKFLAADVEIFSRERMEAIRGLEQQKELLKYKQEGQDVSYLEHRLTLQILELKKEQAQFEIEMAMNLDERYKKTQALAEIEFEIEKEKLRYSNEAANKAREIEERKKREREEEMRLMIERYDTEIAKIQEVFGIMQETNRLRGMGGAGEGLGIATAALNELMVAEQVYNKQVAMSKSVTEIERANALKRISIARGLWGMIGGMVMSLANTIDASEEKMFYINKMYSLGVATINTAEAITKALASAPPPVNYGLAAAVSALGAAQIALIASQTYKSPSTNVSVGVGEMSSASAVTPSTSSVGMGLAPSSLPEGFGKVINVYIEGAVLGGTKEEVANELIGYIRRAEERSV